MVEIPMILGFVMEEGVTEGVYRFVRNHQTH